MTTIQGPLTQTGSLPQNTPTPFTQPALQPAVPQPARLQPLTQDLFARTAPPKNTAPEAQQVTEPETDENEQGKAQRDLGEHEALMSGFERVAGKLGSVEGSLINHIV